MRQSKLLYCAFGILLVCHVVSSIGEQEIVDEESDSVGIRSKRATHHVTSEENDDGTFARLPLFLLRGQGGIRQPESKSEAEDDEHWSYRNIPAWQNMFPRCRGRRQSPIVIHPNAAVPTPHPKFTFHNYGRLGNMVLQNDGHTACYELPKDFPKDRTPFITGGGYSGKYNFFKFHIHWDSIGNKGSEHLLGSRSFPAEVHLMHYNEKYGSPTRAGHHPDGLAVLATFVKFGPDTPIFDILTRQLGEIPEWEDKTVLRSNISLHDVLPTVTSSFYRYDGSFTTPGCKESVIWTVFDQPITISPRQLSHYRTLLDKNDQPLLANVRPPQPINGRLITFRPPTMG